MQFVDFITEILRTKFHNEWANISIYVKLYSTGKFLLMLGLDQWTALAFDF